MNTTNKPSRSRFLTVIWLVLSQLGGATLVLPFILGLFIAFGGGRDTMFYLACVSIVLPVGFALAAWIAFARRKDKAAAILSGLYLLLCFIEAALIYNLWVHYKFA